MGISQPVSIVSIVRSLSYVEPSTNTLKLSPWVMMKAGGMDMQASTVGVVRTYTHRLYNLDPETLSEIIFEFASLVGDATNILGMAISLDGTANNPGPGGWQRVTFGGGNVGGAYGAGTLETPYLLSSDPLTISGGWAPNQSMVIRITINVGRWTYGTRGRATEINWPNTNLGRSADGDFTTTPELLAINPTWSGLNLGTTWYGIRTKRVTPVPHILTHGDSVNMGSRGTSSVSGHNWLMILNALAAGKFFASSCGHGGTTLADAESRNPYILSTHAPHSTHLMVQTWSGNGSPVDIGDTERIKTNILNMEAQAFSAGLKFWVCTLKPHGTTISTQTQRDAYWHLVDWATTRYGVRHIDLSQESTLSSDGGLTLLNSDDGVHFNAAGQSAQATALKPRFEAALIADGYTL